MQIEYVQLVEDVDVARLHIMDSKNPSDKQIATLKNRIKAKMIKDIAVELVKKDLIKFDFKGIKGYQIEDPETGETETCYAMECRARMRMVVPDQPEIKINDMEKPRLVDANKAVKFAESIAEEAGKDSSFPRGGACTRWLMGHIVRFIERLPTEK